MAWPLQNQDFQPTSYRGSGSPGKDRYLRHTATHNTRHSSTMLCLPGLDVRADDANLMSCDACTCSLVSPCCRISLLLTAAAMGGPGKKPNKTKNKRLNGDDANALAPSEEKCTAKKSHVSTSDATKALEALGIAATEAAAVEESVAVGSDCSQRSPKKAKKYKCVTFNESTVVHIIPRAEKQLVVPVISPTFTRQEAVRSKHVTHLDAWTHCAVRPPMVVPRLTLDVPVIAATCAMPAFPLPPVRSQQGFFVIPKVPSA